MDTAPEAISTTITSDSITSEPAPTLTPSPEPTPAPTAKPITRGPALITNLQLQNDFSAPFNMQDWIAVDEDLLEIYSMSTQYSMLRVSMDGSFHAGSDLFLELAPANLPEHFNAIAVSIPLLGPDILESHGGVRISLSDDRDVDALRCGILQHEGIPVFACELFEQDGQRVDRNLAFLSVPKYQLQDVCIAWQAETGLVLLFLNDQLVGYHQMDAAGPVHAVQAGIFVNRYHSYDGGTFLFTDLRTGTPVETSLNLPDDLLPLSSPQFSHASHSIDYYLADDFNNPALDGLGDYTFWNMNVPDRGQARPGATIDFRQTDGMLHVSGSGDLMLELRDQKRDLRALEADFEFTGESPDESAVMFQLAARGTNSIQLEYMCHLTYRSGPWGIAYCHAFNPQGEILHITESIPFRAAEPIRFGILWDDAQKQFEAHLNGLIVDRAPMESSSVDIINRLPLTPGIVLHSTDSHTVTMDNFQYGLMKEEFSIPEEDAREMITSLPHSDLFLYDDFTDPDFNTIWNFGHWTGIVSDSHSMNQGLYQQDGSLVIKRLEDNQEIGAWKILANQFEAITPEQANAILVDVHGDPDHEYQGNTGMILMLAGVERPVTVLGQRSTGMMTRNGSGFSCGLYYFRHVAHFRCSSEGYPNSQEYSFGPILLDSGLHQIALEYVPPERTFYAYLDGEQATQFTIQGWQLENLVLDIQAQADAEIESGDRVYIDQVLIGTPAEHPELVSTPEAPFEPFDMREHE